MTFDLKFKKLIKWINSKNWDIEFGTYEDQMLPFDRIIQINNKFKIENQLYACLHECGHLILRLNKNYKYKYPHSYKEFSKPTKNKKLIKTKQCQIDIISEEIDAWNKGKWLAKKLNLNINEENYNKEMYKFVFTYIKQANV